MKLKPNDMTDSQAVFWFCMALSCLAFPPMAVIVLWKVLVMK